MRTSISGIYSKVRMGDGGIERWWRGYGIVSRRICAVGDGVRMADRSRDEYNLASVMDLATPANRKAFHPHTHMNKR